MSDEGDDDRQPRRAPDPERARAAVARFRPRDSFFTRTVTKAVVGLSRYVMQRRNQLLLEGEERLRAVYARAARPRGEWGAPRGLLTFSNHVSLLDDPLLVSCFALGDYASIRWVGADAFNFFGDPLRGVLFSAGKCVPLVRGQGEEQDGFAFLRERLRAGDWVHLFPEGGRTRDPEARLRLPFKAGIGRLLDETRPVALPWYHVGMDSVLPIGARLPRKGQSVRLRFGEAAICDDDFVRAHAGELEERPRWEALTRWAQGSLRALEMAMRD